MSSLSHHGTWQCRISDLRGGCWENQFQRCQCINSLQTQFALYQKWVVKVSDWIGLDNKSPWTRFTHQKQFTRARIHKYQLLSNSSSHRLSIHWSFCNMYANIDANLIWIPSCYTADRCCINLHLLQSRSRLCDSVRWGRAGGHTILLYTGRMGCSVNVTFMLCHHWLCQQNAETPRDLDICHVPC